MIPNWADDIQELDAAVIHAQGQTANLPQAGSAGESVHIGIIDSAWKLPSEITDGYDVIEKKENAFIDTTKQETAIHAREVFHRIASYCPDATITLYQAVTEENSLPLGAYSDAISAAINDDVDILNLSAGDPWPAPVDVNPCVHETRRAIDEGITIVAAAGNADTEDQEDRPPVHCPAAFDPVIAVGAMEVRCPASIGSEPEDQRIGPYYCFSEDTDDLPGDSSDRGVYCSQNGCVDGGGCLTKQKETEWDGNPLPTGNKPDILAPMHAPQSNGDAHFYRKGTSFSAPIVTGPMGCIFGEIISENMDIPDPYDVREAIREGGAPIDSGDKLKYDAMGTRRSLGLI